MAVSLAPTKPAFELIYQSTKFLNFLTQSQGSIGAPAAKSGAALLSKEVL